MDGEPMSIRVFEVSRNSVETGRLERREHARRLSLRPDLPAEIDKVGNRLVLLGDQGRERLPGVLVVRRHRNPETAAHGGELSAPPTPAWRAVVANRDCALGEDRGRTQPHGREGWRTRSPLQKFTTFHLTPSLK